MTQSLPRVIAESVIGNVYYPDSSSMSFATFLLCMYATINQGCPSRASLTEIRNRKGTECGLGCPPNFFLQKGLTKRFGWMGGGGQRLKPKIVPFEKKDKPGGEGE